MALEFLKVKEEDAVRVDSDKLEDYISRVFQRHGITAEDATTCAHVLVMADLWGIDSHGVSNAVKNIYLPSLEDGRITPTPDVAIVHETPATALVDGGNGMGMIAGTFAMQLAIKKASDVGMGTVAVRNSRHYGAAGFYARMALEHDMIGTSMTNTGPIVVPTFGRQPMLGTNPIAVAAPANEEDDFVLDMATSTVASQKVAIAGIVGAEIPLGWAVDRQGTPTTDPLLARESRALLPLGGTREQGSHKGYGLAMVVDILCGVLSGVGYGGSMPNMGRRGVGHYFSAVRIDAFQPASEFKEMMDNMVRDLRASDKAEGEDRIFTPGEIEVESEAERRAQGIPLHKDVMTFLDDLAHKFELDFNIAK